MTDLTTRFTHTVRQHFVSLSCVQQPLDSDSEKLLVFSGFVVEIAGEWLYVTAGHILRNIEKAIAAGSTFDVWRLAEHTVEDKFAGIAVPFDFQIEHWYVIENEEIGLDYAAVRISPFYRRQLEAGGVKPLANGAWGTPAMEYEHWVLVGVPSESVVYDGETIITARLVAAPLHATDAPPLAGKKCENQFFARLADGHEEFVENIDGMSGGPIFMLRWSDNNWKYGVIGVQSGWYPTSRVIAACPIKAFALEIEAAIKLASSHVIQPEDTENMPGRIALSNSLKP